MNESIKRGKRKEKGRKRKEEGKRKGRNEIFEHQIQYTATQYK